MSLRRLVVTAAVLAGAAAGLTSLAGSPAAVLAAVRTPQHLVDGAGPEALVVAVAGALAWLVWAWGALGLVLAATGTIPGAAGAVARLVQRALVPAAGRRAAAVLLGVGVGLAGPGGALSAAAAGPAATAGAPVPDWPPPPAGSAPDSYQPATASTAPDWPTATTQSHLVVPGDCLWHIAGGWLGEHSGRRPADAEITAAVQGWWIANADVIGRDPDLLLPGQVLHPPDAS